MPLHLVSAVAYTTGVDHAAAGILVPSTDACHRLQRTRTHRPDITLDDDAMRPCKICQSSSHLFP